MEWTEFYCHKLTPGAPYRVSTQILVVMTCPCQRKDRDKKSLRPLGSPRTSRRSGSVSRMGGRRNRRDLLRSASVDQYEHLAHFEMINFNGQTDEETDVTDSLEENRSRRIILNHSHSFSKVHGNQRRR